MTSTVTPPQPAPVCREWHYDSVSKREDVHELCREHNALARAHIAKCAEVEELTAKFAVNNQYWPKWQSEKARAEAAEARAAKLLEALESMRGILLGLSANQAQHACQIASAAIAAAKGETV